MVDIRYIAVCVGGCLFMRGEGEINTDSLIMKYMHRYMW